MINLAYVLCGLCMLFALLKAYYGANGQHFKEVSFKTLASVTFIALGVFALIYNAEPNIALYGGFVMLGGVLGLAGDIFLGVDALFKDTKEVKFVHVWGVVCFFLGHVSYMVAVLSYCDFIYWLIPFMFILPLIYIVVGITKTKIFDNKAEGSFMTLYFAALNIGIVGAINAVVQTGGNVASVLILVASSLFAFSDIMLGIAAFSNKIVLSRSASSYIVTLTYYPAQILYMLSILFVTAVQ